MVDILDDEDKDDEVADSPTAVAPANADTDDDSSDDGEDTQPAPINPVLAAYLQSKSAMADAQDKAAKNQMYAGLAEAASQFAHGSSPEAFNSKDFDFLNQMATSPIQKAQAQQKAGVEALQAQNLEMQTQKAAAENDPNSAQSLAVKNLINKLYPGKFSEGQLDDLSAADVQDTIFKPLELDEKIQSARSSKQDALNAKTQAGYDKAYTQMRKDLETFKGNQSAQQAALGIQNADKALALTNAAPTSQNLQLLADEMGKVATGGVPGEHGTQALMPNNLATKIAELKSFAMSSPSSADVSEYMKNNKDYLAQIKNIAGSTLNSYRSNIAKGYKNRVKPDDYQEAVDDYNLGSASKDTTSQNEPMVNMLDPQGNLRAVPQSKVRDAITAGGKLAQ